MCVLSIKVPIRKKAGNLFNDPCVCVCVCVIGWLFRFNGLSTFVGYLMRNPFLCK